VEIENEIKLYILLLRTEQKEEEEFKVGDPWLSIEVYPDIVYPDIVYPDINNLKQLSKHVQTDLLKHEWYDIINYTKKYKGDIQYINITYQTTPKFDVGKYIATELLYYNGNTGYRISYGMSPDLISANKHNLLIMNEISENIIESTSNKNDYSNIQTTTTNNITNLLFEKYYPIVKVEYESDSMIPIH